MAALKGRIWRKLIDKQRPAPAGAGAQDHFGQTAERRTLVHVYSPENPGHGFEPVEPDLEDVYFTTMAGHIGTHKPEVAR